MASEDQYKHHDTPIKAKIQEAIEFCERMNLSCYKNDVFRTFEVRHIDEKVSTMSERLQAVINEEDKMTEIIYPLKFSSKFGGVVRGKVLR